MPTLSRYTYASAIPDVIRGRGVLDVWGIWRALAAAGYAVPPDIHALRQHVNHHVAEGRLIQRRPGAPYAPALFEAPAGPAGGRSAPAGALVRVA